MYSCTLAEDTKLVMHANIHANWSVDRLAGAQGMWASHGSVANIK